jgi:hypothetical protein
VREIPQGWIPVLLDGEVRVFGLKIALYGVALMLIGIGLANQLQGDSTTTISAAGREAERIVPMIPSIAGALLTFWGSIRLSLVVPLLPLAAAGLVLAIVATAFPLAAAEFFPDMRTYQWTLPSLLPLFVLRITGLIFFSTAVLRWLLSFRKRI